MQNRHFFIVGGQRCGSTMLARCLDSHPEIEMAKPIFPEPKYFLNPKVDKAEYLRNYFHDTEDTSLRGEKSTTYYESENAAQRIKQMFPEAQIVFILRNPVSRALSNYFFTVQNNLEPRSLDEVFVKHIPEPNSSGEISTNPYGYLARGEYGRYVNLYWQYFEKDKVYISILEELAQDKDCLIDLLKFLGVDPSIDLTNMIRVENHTEWRKSDIPREVLIQLGQYYQQEVRELEHLLGKRLDFWELP